MPTDNVIFRSDIALASRDASVIQEVVSATHETTYLGFAKNGATDVAEPKFAIQRIQKEIGTGITTLMWAGGTIQRQYAFSDAAILTYSFKK